MSSFVHLHNHTEYSHLDGHSLTTELLARAEELGMPAVAITDHGNMFGAYEFWKTAQNIGVKPIIGIEAYLTPGTHRTQRERVRWGESAQGGDDVSASGAYTHMTMLAENNTGMHNLFRLSSLASMEGFYHKPRMDREIVERYHEGVIATTGCPSGEIQTRLRLGQYDKAVAAAAEFRDIFGAENFFLEVMDHGIDIERRVRADLLRLGKDLNLPLLATNDSHYTLKEACHSHDVLLAVQSHSQLSDENRFKFNGDSYYLRSAAEMRDTWRDHPDACDNTLLVAERCEVSFTEEEGRYMPHFPVPEGESETSLFIKEVQTGLQRRFPGGVPQYALDQAKYEQEIIISKGYAGYFLVVADFINWAKSQGIRVGPGRGSGAGSTCAYAMGITHLDPTPHGLIFERFLNPERMSMPDFDVDFDDRRRAEVIDYVSQKYGEEYVAMIVTHTVLKAKSAIKDSARVMGFGYDLGDAMAKLIPGGGDEMTLAQIDDSTDERYAESKEFHQYMADNPVARQVFDTAKGIEKRKRGTGVHAAGVIMSSQPLMDVIPLFRRAQDGQIITGFDYPICESLGLVKMDFLGLRNLTLVEDAVVNIRENRGITVDLDELSNDMTDEASYELLQSGECLGVFQLDGGGMRTLLKTLKPESFEDISAALALYRPGPMDVDAHNNYVHRKHGRQNIVPLSPELEGKLQPEMVQSLEPILASTYGLVVYQEQVMEIAQKLAGYSLGKADLLRRAMGKKKKYILDQEYGPFAEGMREHGFEDFSIESLWNVLVPFAGYAFNKAHSAAYGVVAYWTAYLKANFPAEFMAALLTSVQTDKDKTAIYLGECRRMGIEVLPPDVNTSVGSFAAVGTQIRFGMAAIRNVGHKVVDGIVQARREKGAFTDFADFLRKSPANVVKKRAVEALIKSGAFDELGHSRRALMEIYETYIDALSEEKKQQARGQESLFAALEADLENPLEVLPPIGEASWDRRTQLSFEREMLGRYVSDHPLSGFENILARNSTISIAGLLGDSSPDDGDQVTISGLVSAVQYKRNKKGQTWAIATIEDLNASIDVLFFHKTYARVGVDLVQDAIVAVQGRFNVREAQKQIYGSEMSVLRTDDSQEQPVVLNVRATRVSAELSRSIQTILEKYPGPTPVYIAVHSQEEINWVKLSAQWQVTQSPELLGELKILLGVAGVQ